MSVQLNQILGYTFFTDTKSTFAIVLIESMGVGIRKENLKAYIGNCAGGDEKTDIYHVANNGARFPVQEAISILKKSGNYNTSFEDREFLKLIFDLKK